MEISESVFESVLVVVQIKDGKLFKIWIPQQKCIFFVTSSVLQNQKKITAHLKSKQLLPRFAL